ncbi:zinc finger protein 827-like [Betta splendens]|uniref:Zinc finger protein 827-like n=1 Tax=Betta splendens TaxID=158456 RepID=A0A6P7PAT4_BETSP|nr:zinc finger protein 827-like [Betta splendens]XP_029027363.1 zinc finger protein 827-like [Betta splendens]
MKRGSSVLQPPSDAAKRHTQPSNTHVRIHTSDDARLLSAPDTRATGSSPFPAATSLFSPDVSTKMASDLLIRLSEATQKAQVHPGSRAEPQRREALLEVQGGQQDEPGLALSPDGPGASPEPPSLTHTPDGNAAADTLASDLLRKLAERQEVNCLGVRVKEEEEPVEVDTIVMADHINDRTITKDVKTSSPKISSYHLFSMKTENQSLKGTKMAEQLHTGAKMADQCLLGLKLEDTFFTGGCQAGFKTGDGAISGASKFEIKVKMEDNGVSGPNMGDNLLSGAKMEEQLLFKAKIAERPFSRAKMSGMSFSGVKTEEWPLPGAKIVDQGFSRTKTEEQLIFGAKMEDQLTSGAKMADQCLRAVLWQDMSVNLASTLLHQLSERVSKSNNQLVERMSPPIRTSPDPKVNMDPLRSPPLLSSQEPPLGSQSSLSRDPSTGCSYFYRCHVCGFETDLRALFQSHMTEHRQWERSSFSLHCCVCDHSTNQEAEMRVHADTHVQGDTGVSGDMRCPPDIPPAASAASCSALAVAMATQPDKSASEHRCRICQRSFPGQQELLVHFQGHRQGNQYRCDRCGHLTRTANKLVEHVRVHTGERPFTCDLCPYSAKRRDSLRLHCKVKHAAHMSGNAADAPSDVHTHRSYVHGDNQRSNKHVQRLHTPLSTHTAAASSLPPLHPSLSDRAGWKDLSPLLPITTLISLKPRPSSSSSSSPSSSSTQHLFLSYLGLTTS